MEGNTCNLRTSQHESQSFIWWYTYLEKATVQANKTIKP